MIKVKLTVSAIIICCLFLLISGCSKSNNNADIVGNWVPTTASLNGQSVNYSDLGLQDDYFGFTFNDDGSCNATLAGVKGNGKYTFNNTSVDVTINNESRKLTYEKGTLTLTLDFDGNSTQFTFVKTTVE